MPPLIPAFFLPPFIIESNLSIILCALISVSSSPSASTSFVFCSPPFLGGVLFGWFLFFLFFDTGFLCVTLVFLELALWIRKGGRAINQSR